MKRIVFTGGGTAGHVTPNIALFPRLKELGYDIQYIGSYDGIEKKLIADYGIPYYGIATGKLRRYFTADSFQITIATACKSYRFNNIAVYLKIDHGRTGTACFVLHKIMPPNYIIRNCAYCNS